MNVLRIPLVVRLSVNSDHCADLRAMSAVEGNSDVQRLMLNGSECPLAVLAPCSINSVLKHTDVSRMQFPDGGQHMRAV